MPPRRPLVATVATTPSPARFCGVCGPRAARRGEPAALVSQGDNLLAPDTLNILRVLRPGRWLFSVVDHARTGDGRHRVG
jgi:hypothetical protein